MSAFGRLSLTLWVRSFGLVHGAGVLLLALAVATEAAAQPTAELVRRLRADVPYAWALLSPALTLAAAALGLRRLRDSGELVALGTLGVSPRRVRWGAVVAALPVAALAVAVGAASAPTVEAARVAGGWVVAGRTLADPGGPLPDAAAVAAARFGSSGDWPATGVLLILAAGVGARLGETGHTWGVLLAAAGWVLADVLRRGHQPVVAALFLLAMGAAAALSAARRSRRGAR